MQLSNQKLGATLNKFCDAPANVPDGMVVVASPLPVLTQEMDEKAMVSAVALDSVAGVVTVRAALPTAPGIR